MKLGLNILGALALLIGVVWMLQGLDILGGSFMSGQNQWFVIGAICAAAGVVVLGLVNFLRR
jgi:hypothetical protein